MKIESIEYRDFRNIEEGKLVLADGLNLLIGENAAGKTSALEGCYLFAAGRSHRTAREKDLIRDGAPFAELRLRFYDAGQGRSRQMQLRYLPYGRDRSRKQWLRDGIPISKLSECIGIFRAVLFCPGHLGIVGGGPGERRTFLDGAISQIDRRHIAELQNYRRLLNQRNELLGCYHTDRRQFSETIELWSRLLAESGEKVASRRAEYCVELEKEVAAILRDMSGGREKIELQYKKPATAKELFASLMSNHEREAKMGGTLYGPHRDDIEIRLDGKSAREFGSQGQQRSIAVAMKLAEGALSRAAYGEYPVFLLDDILSELDENRQRYLLDGIRDRQVLLTVPSGGLSDALRQSAAACFRVEQGLFAEAF